MRTCVKAFGVFVCIVGVNLLIYQARWNQAEHLTQQRYICGGNNRNDLLHPKFRENQVVPTFSPSFIPNRLGQVNRKTYTKIAIR